MEFLYTIKRPHCNMIDVSSGFVPKFIQIAADTPMTSHDSSFFPQTQLIDIAIVYCFIEVLLQFGMMLATVSKQENESIPPTPTAHVSWFFFDG